jgi:hypothetical protein
MVRWLAAFILLLAVLAGGAYVVAGRGTPPQLSIDKPERVVGQNGTLEVTAGAPNAQFTALTISLEQNGTSTELFTLPSDRDAGVTQVDRDRLRISSPFGKQSVPQLQPGTARIIVAASRRSFLRLRTLSSQVTKDIQVKLDPPTVTVVSTHHYVNHGGSEMVVYRTTPPEVHSGVRVGDVEYPGFPVSVAGATAESGLKAAFFALLHDQDLKTPIVVFAEDEAGNQAKAVGFIDKVFEKPFKRSKIALDDKFLAHAMDILDHAPELKLDRPSGDLIPAFLRINGDLRRLNADAIAKLASSTTSSSRLWDGPFVQLGNSQVEASFADHRTYFYKGKEVDQQVHLGFDLAVTSNVPIVAANAGKVLNASWLGIYGNCVIIDHGMGIGSLYGHLSSFDVKPGDSVTKGQTIGRSGMTGLAGGDHLHFTLLVNGRMVNPVEWWDPHWIRDRVDRKLKEAEGPSAAAR